ncbi:MAG: type IV toxin-antitoxin system AbiEi family antitoxin domain-containing protein [Gammaproteobacteria bacterium]
MQRSKSQLVLDLARKSGVIRARDITGLGIPTEYLRRLHRRGLLVRVGRGLYMLPRVGVTAQHSLAQVSKKIPNGVICLLSALQFHQLGTQAPSEVWVALDRKARPPRADSQALRLVRMSGEVLAAGVQEHRIEKVPVRIYGPAKTVADCFKYRNKIGMDIALEALRDYRRRYPRGTEDLWRYAHVCRVTHVMRPYLEALAEK